MSRTEIVSTLKTLGWVQGFGTAGHWTPSNTTTAQGKDGATYVAFHKTGTQRILTVHPGVIKLWSGVVGDGMYRGSVWFRDAEEWLGLSDAQHEQTGSQVPSETSAAGHVTLGEGA